MRRIFTIAVLLAGALAAPPAGAEFIVRIGNTVYVDGKAYDWEEWKKIRDDPRRLTSAATLQPPQGISGPAPQASTAAVQEAAGKAAAGGPHAASCMTAAYFDEFPSEEERFQCGAALGALTREEILRAGWKIDLIEKIPAPAGLAAPSARGLPVYKYKMVISR